MNNEEQSHEIENGEQSGLSRRGFLHGIGGVGAFLGMAGSASADESPKGADGKVIPGFEKGQDDPNAAKGWQQVSDRKVRVPKTFGLWAHLTSGMTRGLSRDRGYHLRLSVRLKPGG